MSVYKLQSPFYFGDKVIIDGHKDVIGNVMGIWFKDNDSCEIHVSWWNHSDLKDGWFAMSRLALVPK